ncbi:transposase [Burkholderia cepacia]|uniref:transposase n=1 Tax=Burkholderia cepacia TaxID=292 RepID=UPI002AB7B018|nr:transposase [Burkholderia cepacia]
MRIKSAPPGNGGDAGRTAADNSWFIEAVLWIGRTGSPWRDVPEEFGIPENGVNMSMAKSRRE